MQVACCQFDIAWEDKPANYRRVTAIVREAKLEPGTLLLLPEMFATGFSMNTAVTAEPPPGPTTQYLSDLAREHRIFIMGGVVSPDPVRPGRAYNEAHVYDATGSMVTSYTKMHLFSFAGEDKHYTGAATVAVFDLAGCRVAPSICYDLRFPEFFRRATHLGATLLTVIANWPAARESHWLALLKARAIENQAYVAAVNRVGTDGNGHAYTGRSQIIDPTGEVLADAQGTEGVIRADVDVEALLAYRKKFPALEDMKDRWFQ